MSEERKQIMNELITKLPTMTERQKGYLEGVIATAAAMAAENEGQDIEEHEEQKTA